MRQTDRVLVCRRCGTSFLYTAWQQRQGQAEPAWCPGCTALEALSRKRTGTVKWYDVRRGYGFLTDDSGEEVFVHRSALTRPRLRARERVEYSVEPSERGLVATQVVHRERQ